MANLKNKILQALKSGKNLETTLNDISINQENLLKNHSNPVFNDKDKNKILRKYTDLENLGQSLYRYNSLKKNNYETELQEEKENIENTIVKGGVSYNKYIWHSENSENTCDLCKSLDGIVFDFYDEVPQRPHPNCKCYVEIIEDENEEPKPQNNSEEEPCDIIEQLNDMIIEIENANEATNSYLQEIKSDVQDLENDLERVNKLMQETNDELEILGKKYLKHIPECENNIDADYEHMLNQNITLEILWNDIQKLLEMGWAGIGTFAIFASNYVALLVQAYGLKQYEMDKYYHSKANCEATQMFGELGEEAAVLLSDTKEKFDQWNNVYAKSHKVTIKEAIADSERDQIANRLGRERGRKYPDCKCYELMQDLKPKKRR